MKKFIITTLCVALITVIGTGALPQRAHAGGIINAIVAFVAAPLALVDPITSLVIVDAFSCKVNVIWGCDKNGDPLPEPVPVVTLTSPASIELANPLTLTWSANARAVSCAASGNWNGDKALSGSESVINPTDPASLGSHTYALACKNSEGRSGTATTSINVIGPVVSITAPAIVEVPDKVALNWTSQNTVSCVASGEWSGNKAVSGTENDSVATRGNHTYGLTCINGSGYSASASVDITVVQVPKCTFSANPSVITPPQSSRLSWTCDYATSCSINHGIGSVTSTSGSRSVLPSTTTDYTLRCQGVDGSRPFSTTVGIPGTGGVPFPAGATTSTRIHEVNP